MVLKKKTVPEPAAECFKIPLGRGLCAILDAADYFRLGHFYWQAKKSKSCWYAVRKIRKNGKTFYVKMHREVLGAVSGFEVHHLNRNSLDNRRVNLLICSSKAHKYFHK